jgi:hypothetical protein
MSHAISGSDKLKANCQTLASLSTEEINQIAGGAFGINLQTWMIRGIPADIYRAAFQPQVQVDIGGFDVGGFRF